MTTARQVKLLAAPLLARHQNLALVSRSIVFAPADHFLRFIMIARTSVGQEFEPLWAVTDLFSVYQVWPLALSRFMRRDHRTRWLWDDPSINSDFIDIAEREALPALRRINSLEDYVRFALPNPEAEAEYPTTCFKYNLALGNLAKAASVFADCPNAQIIARLNKRRQGLGSRILTLGERLNQEDRVAIADYLHEVEAQTVRNLKLGKVWERTPFPIEAM